METTTPARTNLSTGIKIGFWCYICLSLAAVFYLPGIIPATPVASGSYVFGYNNHAGFLLFVFLTAIGAVWARQFGLRFSAASPSDQIKNRTFFVCMAIALAACAFMYLLTSHIGAFGESAYLINRIELASRGLHPYRDFEYPYGALFIYLPLLLSRLLGLSIPNAYYLFWMLNVLLGVWLMAAVINRIDYHSEHKNQIFVLLFLSMLPGVISTGTNYTGFRYLVAPFFALLVFRVMRDGSLKSQIKASLLAVVSTILLLLVSPEIGIAFSLGVSAFFVLFYFRSNPRRWVAPYLGMLLLFLSLMIVANRFSVFYTFKAMGSGGNNFPIIPAPHILILFFSAFFAALYFVTALWQGDFRSNLFLVLLISLPPLAASLARCDPGHIVFNGAGIFLVALLCIAGFPRIWRWYCPAFVFVLFVLTALSYLFFYGNTMRYACIMRFIPGDKPASSSIGRLSDRIVTKTMVKRFGEAEAKRRLAQLRTLSPEDATLDSPLLPPQVRGDAEIPFGYGATHNLTSLDGGYYFATTDAFDAAAVNTKISELAAHPERELILPERYEDECRVDPQSLRKLISELFLFPYRGKAKHTESAYKPLCDYIDKNYSLTVPPQPNTFQYGVWSRK
jgi:hypothetical protein